MSIESRIEFLEAELKELRAMLETPKSWVVTKTVKYTFYGVGDLEPETLDALQLGDADESEELETDWAVMG